MSMTITRFTPSTPAPFRTVDSFSLLRIDEPSSLSAVLELVRQEQQTDPGARYLITLDDINQCLYTSGHARESDEIYYDADYDMDDPASVAQYQQAELAYVAAQLDDPALRRDWRDVGEKGLTSLPEDIAALVEINRHPDLVLDDAVYVQKLPVARDDLLIAGLPNGYFSCDWDIFDNHAVIRLLHDHDYRFFGIGAGWLGFIREDKIDPAKLERLIADLMTLYGQAENTQMWGELKQVIRNSPYLLLGYIEDFSRILES
ncbi:MAG: hypothetical protein FWC42_02530 [Proteobacteria bacterium]|nr:hypothetical protein [Pseudomonadota bacterium]MCL2309140.1 hypothetical protein [Pseudomonadota bacterium]